MSLLNTENIGHIPSCNLDYIVLSLRPSVSVTAVAENIE